MCILLSTRQTNFNQLINKNIQNTNVSEVVFENNLANMSII